MRKNSKNIGDDAEERVCEYLRRNEYEILERNYRVYGGEVDIIAKKSDQYVFVEVKFRKNTFFVHPVELFDAKKRRAFLRAVYHFMAENNLDEENIRIDLIALIPKKTSS